ncbi:hypothetical protein HanIR_Chr13g0644991 [Helianthus annuus]|nr:hypothetical protein HanIR_Chr13g0644991 [Helianthus annuus]
MPLPQTRFSTFEDYRSKFILKTSWLLMLLCRNQPMCLLRM